MSDDPFLELLIVLAFAWATGLVLINIQRVLGWVAMAVSLLIFAFVLYKATRPQYPLQ